MNAPLSRDGLREIRALADLACPPAAHPCEAWSWVDWPADEQISLCVLGLTAGERRALERAVSASLERGPLLRLFDPVRAHEADVVVIDAADPAARAWSSHQPWLDDRAVIWIERPASVHGHMTLQRPIAWPTLPIVLAHALRHAPRRARERALVTRSVQPQASAVMVLSGDASARERLRWMLDSQGCRATLARSAREGLAALHAAPYDAVILAGAVPDLDRLALCGRVRSLERRIGRVPLLWLDDAFGGAWDRLRARMAGYDEVVPMPATALQLRELLEAHRGAPRQAAPDSELPHAG